MAGQPLTATKGHLVIRHLFRYLRMPKIPPAFPPCTRLHGRGR